ncbi:MAG: hypothetical protein KF729_34790 [Sandaracinaceae bacterium]|nr:hypothetical protein [Sandaracinaceae bacterium]
MKPLATFVVALLAVACGGAQSGGAASGDSFTGPNELDFLVTNPVRRQMPPERHRGTAVVVSDDGQRMELELRMVDGGDVCRIGATRAGGGPLSVAPSQCSSRFVYEESPTAAVVQIQQGTVTLGEGTLSVALSGQFVANVRAGSGVSEVSGVARWTFEGRR